MTKPVIGISVSYIEKKWSMANQLSAPYVEAVLNAGGIPILLPNELPVNDLPALRSRVNGILLSGGGDVDPSRFNGAHHSSLVFVSRERDSIELSLVKLALENQLPLFGICRGCQVINVALGGTLYTHLPEQHSNTIAHNTPEDYGRNYLAHNVKVGKDSRLARICGKQEFQVNSFHHQGIKKLADSLSATAWAEDRLIEGIELPSHKFLLGVQWHPECLQNRIEHKRLFEEFVTACAS